MERDGEAAEGPSVNGTGIDGRETTIKDLESNSVSSGGGTYCAVL